MTDNPFLKRDRQMVGDIYTAPALLDNLTTLCDDFGSRFGGTAGERQAADFFKAQFDSFGLANVHLEPVDYIGWRRGSVTLEITHPIQKTIPCISLPHSPPADVEALLIDLGAGAPEAFDAQAAAIAGRIVMANSEVRPKGVDRWIHRNEKYGRSLMAGAVGFIFVNHYPGYGPATGGIGHDGEALQPGISVSCEDGAFLSRLLKRHGEVRLRITSSDVSEPMVSWNVFGELPGRVNPAQVVLLGCHYDGHDISQGAGDPASGAVALVEAARVLAAYAPDLPYTIRFALWGVEEIGLLGSTQHVERNQAALDGIRFYLNMDAAGAVDEKGINLNEWPELAPLFEAWAEEMALHFPVGQSVNAHSDHFPFLMAGVPTGGIERVTQSSSGRGYGHTRYDTLDKVEERGLREAAALAARLALRIASLETWPVGRRAPEAVAALFEGRKYEEETAFRNAYDAFVRAARQ